MKKLLQSGAIFILALSASLFAAQVMNTEVEDPEVSNVEVMDAQAENKISLSLPEQSLQRLLDGNDRYVNDKMLHPDRGNDRREATVSGQAPFAAIVGCADSRVAPEIVFDQGIGDLFVVRVAGNVIGQIELESVEFSATVLKSSVVLVLGHQNCGAVRAVVDGTTQDIAEIASHIQPAFEKAKAMPGNQLENTIKMNVQLVVKQLQANPVLAALIRDNKLKVAGGYYRLESGKVELLQ